MKGLSLLAFILIIFQTGAKPQSCLPEGIHFGTQEQIDSFQVNYPGCTEIEGDVEIHGPSITNLNGLSILDSLGGNLSVIHTYLTNLNGLEGLTLIGGSFYILENPYFTSLEGLDSLNSIRGDLSLGTFNYVSNLNGFEGLTSIGGDLYIFHNDSLNSLLGLQNLTSLGGYLFIDANPFLTSLTGLDNIDAGSIDSLYITFNSSLSACDVISICNYLAAPGGTIEIHDNAIGCNNEEEVKALCTFGLTENFIDAICAVYPNPTIGISHFRFQISQSQWVTLKMYDLHGREVETLVDEKLAAGTHQLSWNTADFPPGIYFYRISKFCNQQSEIGKIVVMR